MSRNRRLADFFDHRLARRLIITPVALIAAAIAIATSPLLVAGAAIADLVARRRRWPRLRLVILIIGALVIETIGLIGSFVLWVITGFGLLGTRRWRWHRHRAFMGWYTRAMLGLIVRVLGTRIVWKDTGDLAGGPIVLLARHTSFFDALIPATVLSQRAGLLSHHVVTHGLRYAPCIDIVGHRFPNRFIKRIPSAGSNELGPIEAVGAQLDERSGAIIFPEGTFRNVQNFERATRRIRRRDPETADRAERLRHVLPPRSSGTFALLSGAPDADVLICANTGFESFGSIRAIVEDPYTDRPIVIETWRISRSDIPADADAFNRWLFDQFVAIDAWVSAEGEFL